MKFNYQARTITGEMRAGQVEASSKDAAVALLQKNDFYVTFLEEDAAPIYAKKLKILETISRKDVVMFSRQLAIMFKAKVPLIESLKVLSSQIKNSDFQEKIMKLSEEVEAGTPFSRALSRYPKIFSPFFVAVVKAGEASGSLSQSLNYLADHLEREYNLTAKIRGAMIYPALILMVVFLVIFLMFYYVIPNFAEIFESSGTPLPMATQIVIDMAEFVKKWGWLAALGLFGVILGIVRLSKTGAGKVLIDKLVLKLPIFGSLLKMIYLSHVAENLSTLFSGGLPIGQALDIVADIMKNVSYKKVILITRDGVRRGERISVILNGYPELFSPVFVQMISVGERTGTLDKTLTDIVEFYQGEIDRMVANLLSLMEPLLIVFLGLVVVGIMLSVFAPLYQIMTI